MLGISMQLHAGKENQVGIGDYISRHWRLGRLKVCGHRRLAKAEMHKI